MDPFTSSSSRTTLPWKTVALIGGALVLGAGCIVTAVLLVRGWQSMDSAQTLLDSVATSMTSCDDAANPEYCRQQIAETQAQATGEAIVCDALEDKARQDCLWGTARERLDPQFCEGITDTTAKDTCWNEMNQRLATKNQDVTYCKQIRDEQKAAGCERAIVETLVTSANCEEYYEKDVCVDRATTDQAVAARNPDVCATITDTSRREGCLEEVGIGDRDMDNVDEETERAYGTSDTDKDSDDDGLTDDQEIFEYKTDPTNADSDGDGYSDGQEVAGGYNPLGTGKL